MLALLFLFCTWKAEAKTVLIQAPDTALLDYRAMLKAHPEYTSPSTKYLSQHPLRIHREKLLELFAQAQKSFLENSNEEARGRFEELLDLMFADDWERADREIFLHACLRLAQMADKDSTRDRWLKLSLTLGDSGIDKDLFPPPLLARRQEIFAQTPKVLKIDRLFALGWTVILINGEPCERDSCPVVPRLQESVRVTYLSDRWAAVSETLKLSDLERHTPRATPLVSGECGKEQVHSQISGNERRVFWSLDCEAPPRKLNLQPLGQSESKSHFPEQKTEGPAFYKSKWFWAVVGSAVAAIVVATAQKKESKEPTTTVSY